MLQPDRNSSVFQQQPLSECSSHKVLYTCTSENLSLSSDCSLDLVFTCNTGDQCVYPQQVCDGVQQCLDGSDERSCSECGCDAQTHNHIKHAQVETFWTYRNYVISYRCFLSACHSSTFRCTEDYSCISRSLLCDGYENCPGGTDEAFCRKCFQTTTGIPV